MSKRSIKAIYAISVALFLTSCSLPVTSNNLLNHEIKNNEFLNKTQIVGKVSFPTNFKIKATLTDVGTKATVSIIYPSNHATLANQTIATGLSDINGNFTINPDSNFTPANNEIFILEANKRIGASGNALMSVRSYIKWTGSIWSSITTPSININSKTTAITIIEDKDNSIVPNDTIGKIDVSQQPNIISPIGSVTTQTINDVGAFVENLLTQNLDPTMLIAFQNNKYFINKAPNSSLQGLLATKLCPNCDLKYEIITSQDLSNGDLSNAILNNANLSNTNLTNVNLTNTNLTNATLTGTNLSGANLNNTNFTGVDFSGRDFTNYNLTNTNLTNTNLTNAVLTGATLTGTIFSGSNLTGVSLSGRNLSNYNLSNTNLTNANLSNSILNSTNLTNSILNGINFSGVDFTNRDFTNYNLTNANLSNSILTGTILTGATLAGVNFSNTDLSNKSFVNANINNANFTSANLTNAILKGSNATGAIFTNANLSNVHYFDYSFCPTGSLGTCGDTQVNTYTTSEQYNLSTAMDSNGNYIVVWDSFGQENNEWEVYAQRYNNTGAKIGSEFRVNTYTTGSQYQPAVAMEDNGSFIVAWQSNLQDGSGLGIFAQKYDTNGTPQIPTGCAAPTCNPATGEFQVNSYTTNGQSNPSVTINTNGNFVVAWASDGQDGDLSGVYAKRYNSNIQTIHSEFKTNGYIFGSQANPSVSIDNSDNFVVTWTSDGQDGSGNGIYGQRYNFSGPAGVGAEFRANTTVLEAQANPSVSKNTANGNFVITWDSNNQDGSNFGVYAQRFDNFSNPLGAEFRVNTYTTDVQYNPSVAVDNTGNFIIAWESNLQDGNGFGIFAQRYNSSGIAQGNEFSINASTLNSQSYPDLAINSAGNFVASWRSNLQDGNGNGIFLKRFKFN